MGFEAWSDKKLKKKEEEEGTTNGLKMTIYQDTAFQNSNVQLGV